MTPEDLAGLIYEKIIHEMALKGETGKGSRPDDPVQGHKRRD